MPDLLDPDLKQHRHAGAFATEAVPRSGAATPGTIARAPTFEKVPETAINYRLISHNYQASQTSGMPRLRLSIQVCEQVSPGPNFVREILSRRNDPTGTSAVPR
ncbi:hypothetical protein KM043_014250 [Ampulex compressa]|nr:hypothetical protein KM043_014250 [Ampulex compressa]